VKPYERTYWTVLQCCDPPQRASDGDFLVEFDTQKEASKWLREHGPGYNGRLRVIRVVEKEVRR
jgi:hypothetical protein